MNKRIWVAASVFGAGMASPGLAQSAAPAAVAVEATDNGQDEVIVTGSRFDGRTAIQSATPVDAITRDELERNGRVDLLQ